MEYRLLGPVEVIASDDLPLPLPGAKLRGLVVLLALDAGRVVPAARLIDALYDEPPRNTENALQQVVSRLRRTLADGDAPDRVLTRAPGYCLDEPAEAVDALRFERSVAASRTEPGQPIQRWADEAPSSACAREPKGNAIRRARRARWS